MILSIVVVAFLTLVTITDVVTRDEISTTERDKRIADETSDTPDLVEEFTKYYHERGQDSFGAGLNIGSVLDPINTIAMGDIDNDGYLDLVSGDNGTGMVGPNLYNWRNDGMPWGSPWGSNGIGAHSMGVHAITLGDLDNDGDLDIVTGGLDGVGPFNVYLWENPISEGTDPFAASWSGGSGVGIGLVGGNITDIVVGDLNNDGHVDIITADDGGPTGPFDGDITIWKNTGDPFGGPWTFRDIDPVSAAPTRRVSVAVGDLDNDGDLDIVSGDSQGTVFDWRNDLETIDPFSTMWSGYYIYGGGNSAESVKVGDLDHDGDMDIAAGFFGNVIQEVILDNPLGVSNPFAVSWSSTNIGGSEPVWDLALADLDNDGWLDTITTNDFGDIQGSENDQTPWDGNWEHNYVGDVPTWGRNAIAVGDLDNDGDLDLATGDFGADMDIWNNTLIHRNMPLNTSLSAGPVSRISDIGVGDLDNDGDLDVVTGHWIDNSLYAWRNDDPWTPGSWSFINPIHTDPTRFETIALRLVDFDNDGDLDVASITVDGLTMMRSVFVWENPLGVSNPFGVPWSGGAGVLVGTLNSFGNWIATFDTADFDSDGDVDIATHFFNDTSLQVEVRIWRNPLNEGGNPFNPGWVSRTIGTPSAVDAISVTTGDLDNDGDVDIATSSVLLGGATIYIWENLNSTGIDPWINLWSGGMGVEVWSLSAPGGGDFPRIKTSDLDNDGDSDIVFIVQMMGQALALTNPNDPLVLGNEPFTAIPWSVTTIGISIPINKNMLSIAIGDLDNDGDEEVVTGDEDPGDLYHNITIWINPSTEGFDPWLGYWDNVSYALSGTFMGGISSLALGDLDYRNNTGNNKGGDLDVLHANQNPQYLFIKENIGAQVTENVDPKSTLPTDYNIFDGATTDLMTINETHNGVSWDSDMELATWRFHFEDGGTPLNTGEAQALFTEMYIYLDNGAPFGSWQITDTMVMSIPSASFSLAGGYQSFILADPDLNAVIQADTTQTYFLVVQLTPGASLVTPNTFNVTFDPDGYGTSNWNEVEHEDEDTILSVLYSPSTTAGRFRAVGSFLPDLIPGDLPIPTGIDVDGIQSGRKQSIDQSR